MAEGYSATAANHALNTELAIYTWIKLHTGVPGAAATTNAAGNTTRKQATWRSAASGASSNSAAVTWTSVSTTEDYTHWSCWSAETSGTFGFSGTITANAVTAGDTFEFAIDDLDVTTPVAS